MNVCSFRISVRLVALEVSGIYLIEGPFCFQFNVVLICKNAATDLFFLSVGFKFSQNEFLAETEQSDCEKRQVCFIPLFCCFTTLCLVLSRL